MVKALLVNSYMLQHTDVEENDDGTRKIITPAVRLWTKDLQAADGDKSCILFLNDREDEKKVSAEDDAADSVPEILQDLRMKLRDASHRCLSALDEKKGGYVGKEGKVATIEAACLCKSIIGTIELAVLPYKGNNRARDMARFVLTNIIYNASCDDDFEDQKRRLDGERLELVIDIEDRIKAMVVLNQLVGKEDDDRHIVRA